MKWTLLRAFAGRWLAPALLALAVVTIGGSWLHGYTTGKSAERQVQELRTAQALLRAAAEAERIREHDLLLVMEARDRETRIVERIRTVRVDVPAADCVDLGRDWVREYNRAIETANTGGTDARLP
jgi:hypothetical protein